MKYTFWQATFWFALYVLMVVAPLGLILFEPTMPGRGFWIEFGVALGFAGLSMLCYQFLITGRFRRFGEGFGSDNILQFHYANGQLAVLLVLAHPLVLVAAQREYLAFFDPRVNWMRALALITVTLAALALIALSLWRKKASLAYEWWRLSHGALAMLVLVIGLVHVVQVSYHSGLWWKQAALISITGFSMYLLIHTRLIRPLRMKRRPYRVVERVEERGEAQTLVLEPVGHEGMRFAAGQYAWLTLGETPFSLQQHPFSFSSGAQNPRRLSFTVKPLGDFTNALKDVTPGTKAFLEGPFGAFTLDDDSSRGAIFIAGGVGITPMMSMLRTLSERGDGRALLLFYANATWESVIFREEIEALSEQLNLKVVHVLEEAPPGWGGETGYLTPEILARHLPDRADDHRYYICGPKPMMDMVEFELVARGVHIPHIMSERFDIV